MDFGTIIDALLAVGLVLAGAYLLREGPGLAARPRRGTELKPGARSYRALGAALLAIGVVSAADLVLA